MINLFQSILIKPLVISLLLAIIGTCLLVAKSLYDFSQTGPKIREEIRRRYRWYSVWALLRLALFAILIMTWMSLIGILPFLSFYISHDQELNFLYMIFVGVIGVFCITALQFLYQLHAYPSSIMMSSNYKMSRFYWIWSKLSVNRLRWLRLFLLLVITLPVAQALIIFSERSEWLHFLTISLISTLLFTPYLICIWPSSARSIKATKASNTPLNILMIGCDTLRADRLSACGYHRYTTPFLDALSNQGILFSNCYTPSARTAPSLASLLSGAWPQSHGIRSNFTSHDIKLPDTTLSGKLAQQGYQTVALGDWAGSDLGKFAFGMNHTDIPDDQWNLKYLIRQGPKDIRLFLTLFTHNRLGKHFLPELYYLAGIPLTTELGNETRKWISHFATNGEAFFINTFMATTHPPFGSEYPYYTIYSDPEYDGESKFAMSRLSDPFDIIKSQKEPREAFDLDQIIDLYDGSVRRFDDEVRTIIHHLRDCNLHENTIIVVYSDHGMEFFEHNTWGQGNSAVGEASPRVPMLLVDPRRQGSGVDTRVIRTIDIAPTLLDLCGLEIPVSMDGVTLTPYLDSISIDMNLAAYFETGEWLAKPPGQPDNHMTYPEILELLEVTDYSSGTLSIKGEYQDQVNQARDRMIRQGKWKLVRISLIDSAEYQLYNLESDPNCTTDISHNHPDIVEELKKLLWSLI